MLLSATHNGLLFVNATLVDGLGSPRRRADVLVQDERIAAVGDILSADLPESTERIDLKGLVLAPGFIDMHSHSDLQLLAEPDHTAKLSQGVTLDVLGQDGLSYAPINDTTLEHLRAQLRGWNGDPEDFDWGWRTTSQYLERLDQGIAINASYLVPHGTLRMLVMGTDPRPATREELRQMGAALREGLDSGAVGLSAGLSYVPGMFADMDELVYLCSIVAEYGGYFCPHHRNYGSNAIAGYRECFEIARRSSVALHLAHAHLSFEINREKLPELMALFDHAVSSGVDLTFDSYPYLAGMTTLMSQLPSWAQAGSAREQRKRLTSPDERARIIDALDVSGSDGNHGLTIDWANVHIASVPGAPELSWLTSVSLHEAADRVGEAPSAFAIDILLATGLSATTVNFIGFEAHVRELMKYPGHTVGSDGILVGDRPHPRAWGTFPRMLETYVRNEAVLTLEECIRHMTSTPADRLGLPDRGRVVSGARADLVVFDPATVGTSADYSEPRQAAQGVVHVLVNGQFALRDGRVTGARAGRVARRETQPGPHGADQKETDPVGENRDK